jgi:hypothetical protein
VSTMKCTIVTGREGEMKIFLNTSGNETSFVYLSFNVNCTYHNFMRSLHVTGHSLL